MHSSGQYIIPQVYVSTANGTPFFFQSASQTPQRIPGLTNNQSVQLIIPSPTTPSPSLTLSVQPSSFPRPNTAHVHNIKDCFVRLTRLTCQQIKQRVGQHRPAMSMSSPPKPRTSLGKQLHLLKTSRPRGRPRKQMNNNNNGQCVVRSSSKSMMKLKIVKMPGKPSQCSNLVEKQASPMKGSMVDIQAGNAAAAAVVDSGYFDHVLQQKSENAKKRAKKIMPMIPRQNHDGTTNDVTVISNSHCTPFPSRYWFVDENTRGGTSCGVTQMQHAGKTTQKNICGRVLTGVSALPKANSSSHSNVVAFKPKPVARKRKKSGWDNINSAQIGVVSNNGTARDDGNSWVNELFSTCLASEVVQEALNDLYIPDISFIQNLTEDNIDLTVPISTQVPSTSEFSPNTNKVSSSTVESVEHYEIIDLTSPDRQDEEPKSLEPKPDPTPRKIITTEERLQRLELYEHLYNNDILMIHPEDDELPLPF